MIIYTLNLPNMEYNLKIFLRDKLKRTKTYHQKIKIPFEVSTPEGKVKIDNRGKLIFGAPGWQSLGVFYGNTVKFNEMDLERVNMIYYRLGKSFRYSPETILKKWEDMLKEAKIGFNKAPL